MKEYKYYLRQGSKKDICPNCGKKTFTPYIDKDGNTLADEVGRCDRRDKCQYHYTPKDYFKDNPDNLPDNAIKSKKVVKMPKTYTPPAYIDPADFMASMKGYDRNSFAVFLHSVFDVMIGGEEVQRVMIEYAVGTSKEFGGSPVFWMIDHYGNIRDGKVMGYNPDTGKRIKEPRPLFTNIHTLMKDKYKGQFKPSYFGSHLIKLPKYSNVPLWIFESEKAAIIVAMVMAWGKSVLGLPIATSGCECLNPTTEHKQDPYDRVQLLKNRDIVLFPDNGKFEEWKLKGMGLKGFSKSVYISTVMEKELHPYSIGCGIDEGDALDDVILSYINDKKYQDLAKLLLTSYGYRGQYKIL